MFPEKLDGATILYFTPKGNYGVMHDDTGADCAIFKYLAIGKYDESDGYYLFFCNEHKEVETDHLWNSIDECMNAADCSLAVTISWIKK